MNEGIELHDSELAGVSVSGGEAIVSFSSVYIHRTTGIPGVNSGSGWLQPATITLGAATPISIPVVFPVTVSEGFLRVGSDLHSNMIPANGTCEGAIELSLVLTTAELLTIRGQRIGIRLHGTPSYVETFNQ